MNKILKIIEKISTKNIVISSVISLILTMFIYNIFFEICNYKNLSDFFIGPSIYINHNKIIDIYIYFVYLILFFIITVIFTKGKEEENFHIKKQDVDTKINTTNKLNKFLVKYQYVTLISLLLLHPLTGEIYQKLLFLILLLIIIFSLIIREAQKKSIISPITIALVIFSLIFVSYNITSLPTDEHHFGEKIATFFLADKYNLQYYKDIMLVHGYIDIIPSWIAKYVFNQSNIYGACIGDVLFKNIITLSSLLLASYIFRKNIIFIIPLLFINPSNIIFFMVLSFIFLSIKEKNNHIKFINIFILLSAIFCTIWTTIGTFWIIAGIPLCIYHLQEQLQKDRKKLIYPLFIALFILTINYTQIITFLNEACLYVKGNLYAFGNNFPPNTTYIPTLINLLYKFFGLLFVPILIIELIKNIALKEYKKSLFISFFIIFPLVSLSYTLGRIDLLSLQRLEYISQVYLLVVFPFYLYKKEKTPKKLLIILLILGLLFNFSSITNKFKVYNTNKLINERKNRIEEIKEIINENTTFLDLTNRGMNYLYLNKKPPIKYTSFYNIISTKQTKNELEKLKKNPPDLILIFSNNMIFDNVYPSLRINSIYRWILTSKMYELIIDGENIYLIKNKNEKSITYTDDEKNILDSILANKTLNYLPEVWGNSIKTLPIEKQNLEYTKTENNNEINIVFNKKISGKEIELLYLEADINDKSKHTKYAVIINNKSTIMYCKSKSGKLLIPIDNLPSWMMSDIDKITITILNNSIKNTNIDFYKRI